MTRKIFGFLILISACAWSASGEAKCAGEPLGTADANGVIVFTHRGKQIERTGYKPGDQLCKYTPLKTGSKLEGSSYAHEERPGCFCPGIAPGNKCVHVARTGTNPPPYTGPCPGTKKKKGHKGGRQRE